MVLFNRSAWTARVHDETVFHSSPFLQPIVKQILGVLKVLAGNDKVKVTLATNGGLLLILTAMQKHVKHAGICDQACGALMALVLRQPKSCQLAMAAGAAQAIIHVMQIHTKEEMVQVRKLIIVAVFFGNFFRRKITLQICKFQKRCSQLQ